MWAREAGRRNFPLKHLIFKRNEARAGKQQQPAWLACSYALGSAKQLPKTKPPQSPFICPLSKSGTNRAENLLSGETAEKYSLVPFPWAEPTLSQGWVISTSEHKPFEARHGLSLLAQLGIGRCEMDWELISAAQPQELWLNSEPGEIIPISTPKKKTRTPDVNGKHLSESLSPTFSSALGKAPPRG